MNNDLLKEDEIFRLKEELKSMKKLFEQLTEEKKTESFDIRRSYMLKAQIVQLERQCMLLADALSSKASVLNETENELNVLTEEFQQLLAQDVPGSHVRISRKQLISHIQLMQKLKGSMHKQSVLCTAQNLRIPQISGTKFCKSSDASCFDVCTGKIEHINLQHVSKLETKLTKMFKALTSLHSLMQTLVFENNGQKSSVYVPEKYLFSMPFQRIQNEMGVCLEQLEDCCQDLICLSLLHPSAPWSVVQQPSKFGIFNSASILSTLSPSCRQRKEVKSLIHTLTVAHNYLMHIHSLQLQAIKKQTHFCKQTNETNSRYMNSLLQGIIQAYNACESDLTAAIGDTVEPVLSAWMKLKESQSEENMRKFMSTFKSKESDLSCLIRGSENVNDGVGIQTLKDLGVRLHEQIECLQRECAEECFKQDILFSEYVHTQDDEVIDMLKRLLITGSDSLSAATT